MNIEIDRPLGCKQYSGVATFNTSNIAPKCEYKDDEDITCFAYHKKHSAFQRLTLQTQLNRGLRKLWVDWHIASKSGEVSKERLMEMLPVGQIVLGTINSKSYKTSPKMVVVDGQQRLATLKAAEKIVGEPIEVTLPIVMVEKSTPKELAGIFMKWNACNVIGKGDYISAAVVEGRLDGFMDKLNQVRQKNILIDCEIGIRPNRDRRIKNHEFDIQNVLTWAFYALCGNINKQFMIEQANKISLSAIEKVCKTLAAFDKHIGFKRFQKKRDFVFQPYSSDAMMAALCRLALVEELDEGEWLTTDVLKYWFDEMTNCQVYDPHGEARASCGWKWLNYARIKNTGGNKTKDEVYTAFTRTCSAAQRESGVKTLGIPTGPSKSKDADHIVKFAKPGFGYSPEDKRTDCLEPGETI